MTVTVSLGPEPIPIVDYTGQPADQATQALKTAGFNVVHDTGLQHHGEGRAGDLSITAPAARESSATRVTLDISKGAQLFKVPDVTSNLNDPQSWTSIQQATKTLTDAGFKVAVGSSGRFGVVTRQSPKGGSMQPLGTVITIYAQ